MRGLAGTLLLLVGSYVFISGMLQAELDVICIGALLMAASEEMLQASLRKRRIQW